MGESSVWQTLILISPTIGSFILGMIAWMGKRLLDGMRDQIGDHETEIRDLRSAMQQIQQDAVMKADWLRESGIARKRDEQILEKLNRLEGQNQMGTQIGAAVAAALSRRIDE